MTKHMTDIQREEFKDILRYELRFWTNRTYGETDQANRLAAHEKVALLEAALKEQEEM